MTQEANVVALELEKVSKVIAIAYERSSAFGTKILKAADLEEVSYRALRGPIQINPGGKFGSISLDSTTVGLGRGDASVYDKFTISPLEMRFAVELSQRAIDACKGKERAITELLARENTNATEEWATQIERNICTAGDGILATSTTVAGTTWTFANNMGVQLLRFGQKIQPYSSNAVTPRTAVTITGIDYTAKTITVSSNPDTVSGDVIMPEGLSGANPAWLLGLYYQNSSATTGSWQNLSRVTYPNLVNPNVNASSAFLTTAHFRQVINKMVQFNGTNALKTGDWQALMHYAQQHALEDLGDMITEINIPNGGSRQPVDLVSRPDQTRSIAGFPIMISPNFDPTRIDFIDYNNWGKGVVREVGILKGPNGEMYRTPVSTTDGSPIPAILWYIASTFNFFTRNPRRGFFVYGLNKPAGY